MTIIKKSVKFLQYHTTVLLKVRLFITSENSISNSGERNIIYLWNFVELLFHYFRIEPETWLLCIIVMRHQQNQFKQVKRISSKKVKFWELKLFYCFFKNKSYENNKAKLRVCLNWKLWWRNFIIVNDIGCLGVMTVKLKEHLQIHVYFSNYLQPSLIWSDGNVFADKARNMFWLV